MVEALQGVISLSSDMSCAGLLLWRNKLWDVLKIRHVFGLYVLCSWIFGGGWAMSAISSKAFFQFEDNNYCSCVKEYISILQKYACMYLKKPFFTDDLHRSSWCSCVLDGFIWFNIAR